jgi:hypothetical protein
VTVSSQQFPFLPRDPALGPASLAPLLQLQLRTSSRNTSVLGLLDTGAAVNVLPYAVGEQLGFDWDRQATPVQLSGNLASVEARVVASSAVVGSFAPVLLAFAWAKTDSVPVILGQVNFFLEFDVCFFRSRGVYEVRVRQGPEEKQKETARDTGPVPTGQVQEPPKKPRRRGNNQKKST